MLLKRRLLKKLHASLLKRRLLKKLQNLQRKRERLKRLQESLLKLLLVLKSKE